MRRTLLAALAALSLAAQSLAAAARAAEPPDLVTIVTTAEPETQLMSMVLTMQSLQQGARTHLLLCGPGGDLALKEPPAAATAPQQPRGMSPQGLLRAILREGGTVEVCALYLPNRGLGAEALLEGIAAAKPPAMAARLLAPDTRILSF